MQYWQLNMLTLHVEIYSEVWCSLKRHTTAYSTNCFHSIFIQMFSFSGIKVEELSANLRTAVKPIVTHPILHNFLVIQLSALPYYCKTWG